MDLYPHDFIILAVLGNLPLLYFGVLGGSAGDIWI
jgi:hypothetical protein